MAPGRYAADLAGRRESVILLAMNIRPAPPVIEPDYIDEPITDADWAAMTAGQRALIQEAIDEVDRGEFITHEQMNLEFQRLREKYAR